MRTSVTWSIQATSVEKGMVTADIQALGDVGPAVSKQLYFPDIPLAAMLENHSFSYVPPDVVDAWINAASMDELSGLIEAYYVWLGVPR